MSQENVTQSSWPKWLLILGFPTVGLGAWYLYSRRAIKPRPKSFKTVKVEAKEETFVPESPLDRVLNLKNSGNNFYKEKKYTDALKLYTEAIEICPKDQKEVLSALYQNCAATYDCLGNTQEVINNCSEAIKLNPVYLKALSRRYKAYEKLGKLRDSFEDLTTCCILQRLSNEEDVRNADRILKMIGQEETKKYMQVKPHVMPSKSFLEAYFKSFANDPLKNFLCSEKTDATEGVEAAKNALKDGDYEKIIPHCSEEINIVKETGKEITPKYYEALLLRGTLYVITNEAEKGLADINNIIGSKGVDPKIEVSALLKRVCIYTQEDKTDEALKDFNRAISIDPQNSDIYHHKGQILMLNENIPEAIENFEKAEKINPDLPLIKIQKYYSLYKDAVGNRNVAKCEINKRRLKELVDQYPSLTEAQLLLSEVYSENQEFELAEKMLENAMKEDPTSATVLVHRGLLELQWKRDPENAVKYLEKALQIDNKCVFAYETYAAIAVHKGDFMQAIPLLEKALPLTKSYKETAHIFSLKIASQTQHSISIRLSSLQP